MFSVSCVLIYTFPSKDIPNNSPSFDKERFLKDFKFPFSSTKEFTRGPSQCVCLISSLLYIPPSLNKPR